MKTYLTIKELMGILKVSRAMSTDVRMYESAASTKSFFYFSASFNKKACVSPEALSPFHQMHVYAVLAA